MINIYRIAQIAIIPLKKPLSFSERGWGEAKTSQSIAIWAVLNIYLSGNSE